MRHQNEIGAKFTFAVVKKNVRLRLLSCRQVAVLHRLQNFVARYRWQNCNALHRHFLLRGLRHQNTYDNITNGIEHRVHHLQNWAIAN